MQMNVEELIIFLRSQPSNAVVKVNNKPLLKDNIKCAKSKKSLNLFEPEHEECQLRKSCADFRRKLCTENRCVNSFDCERFVGVA